MPVPDGFSTRYLGIPILLVDFLLMYLWLVVNGEFQKSSSSGDGGGNAEQTTGRKVRLVVQVCGGLLAFLSSVVLVVINSTLIEAIQKFAQKFVDVDNHVLKACISLIPPLTLSQSKTFSSRRSPSPSAAS